MRWFDDTVRLLVIGVPLAVLLGKAAFAWLKFHVQHRPPRVPPSAEVTEAHRGGTRAHHA